MKLGKRKATETEDRDLALPEGSSDFVCPDLKPNHRLGFPVAPTFVYSPKKCKLSGVDILCQESISLSSYIESFYTGLRKVVEKRLEPLPVRRNLMAEFDTSFMETRHIPYDEELGEHDYEQCC